MINKLFNQQGSIHTLPLLLIIAAVGIISFLLITSTAPIGGLFGTLNPKPASQAASIGIWTNVTPSVIDLTDNLSCGNFGITSIFGDPLKASDLYAEADCQGIWKSTDYGQTWTGPINTGTGGASITASAADLAIAPGTPGKPVIYSNDVRDGGPGVWKSIDGGVNWTQLNIGPAGARQDMGWIVVDPYDGNHLIAVPHEVNTALFQSIDAGANWTNVNIDPGMLTNGTGALTFINTGVASTTRNTWLWSAQATGGGIGTWRTANGGISWTKVDNNEKSHGGQQWYQPGTSGVIYMPGVYSSLGWGILRSTDYGQTWVHVGDTGQEAAVFGTPNNIYAQYAWACQFCVAGSGGINYQIAPQPGITGWSNIANPPGMNWGADTASVVFDGSNYIIVTANYNAGIWRYVEPTSGQTPAPQPSVSNASTPTPVPTPSTTPCPSSCPFLGQDQTTQGTWKGVYGADGYSLQADAQSLPSYATVSISNAQTFTWAASTTDVRGLQKAASTTDRLAAAWYNNGPFTIDVNLTDGQNHKVSLYSVDWDGQGRSQTVDVLNASTGAVIDSRTISNFTNGSYLSWNLGGHVQLRITNQSGPNGVVNAIFFDPASSSTSTPVPTPTSTPTPAPSSPACPKGPLGDINCDGLINIFDYNILVGNFGKTVPPNTQGDLNGDGVINIFDYNILVGNFGK